MTNKEQEEYVLRLVQSNEIIQIILTALSNHDNELYLGGGVIRNLVWDHLHGYPNTTPIEDVDVIYYDKLSTTKDHDIAIENKLKETMPNLIWPVKNQARMHVINNDEPSSACNPRMAKPPAGEHICIGNVGRNSLQGS